MGGHEGGGGREGVGRGRGEKAREGVQRERARGGLTPYHFFCICPLPSPLAASTKGLTEGARGAIQAKDRLWPAGDRTTHTIRHNELTACGQRGASARAPHVLRTARGVSQSLCNRVARFIATSVGQVVLGYKCG
jgi:hypothetical protein